jgi:hypothetical protein
VLFGSIANYFNCSITTADCSLPTADSLKAIRENIKGGLLMFWIIGFGSIKILKNERNVKGKF